MTLRQIAGVLGSRLVAAGLVEPGKGLEAAAVALRHLQLYVKEERLVEGVPKEGETGEKEEVGDGGV